MAAKIGSLWEKTSKTGMTFYSGNITINGVQTAIVVFPNKKSKDTHPDFVIQQSEPYVSSKPRSVAEEAKFQEGRLDNKPWTESDDDICF